MKDEIKIARLRQQGETNTHCAMLFGVSADDWYAQWAFLREVRAYYPYTRVAHRFDVYLTLGA